MCGIVGYTGRRQALGVVVEGLSRLEYRGYDSAGVAVLSDSELAWVKRAGKLGNLKSALAQGAPMPGTVGLGHTRWATHGPPTDPNAHPHTDCAGRARWPATWPGSAACCSSAGTPGTRSRSRAR
jgi:glutamine---fructose-6-phosphate transaminase (isomerizing)